MMQDEADEVLVPAAVRENRNEGWDLSYGDGRAGQVPRHFRVNKRMLADGLHVCGVGGHWLRGKEE